MKSKWYKNQVPNQARHGSDTEPSRVVDALDDLISGLLEFFVRIMKTLSVDNLVGPKEKQN